MTAFEIECLLIVEEAFAQARFETELNRIATSLAEANNNLDGLINILNS